MSYRYRLDTQSDDQSAVDSDNSFAGVDQFSTIDSIAPTLCQDATNVDFFTGTAQTRPGFVCLPQLGAASFNITSPWLSKTSAADGNWKGIAYGNGRFVAVRSNSGSNDVMYSTDNGSTWALASTGSNNSWNAIVYGNGLFVTVGGPTGVSGHLVATSPDGITWTQGTTAADKQWNGLAYGNGTFVATCSDFGSNQAMSSTNGSTWTLQTTPAGTSASSINAVAYGNGLFLAVTRLNTVGMTSPDGVTWGTITIPSDTWRGLTFGNGTFVAVSSTASTSAAMASTDSGATWATHATPNAAYWAVAYGNGLFVAVGSSGSTTTNVISSPNGSTWTANVAPTTQNWGSIANGNNTFAAAPQAAASALVMVKSFATTPNTTGAVLASGIYSDPNDAGSQWIMLVGTNSVGFYQFGRSSRTVAIDAAYTVTGQSTIVQCNNLVYLFRGTTVAPLYWTGRWGDTFTIAPTPTPAPGFSSIPNSNQATYYQNRLWVVNGKDTVSASDVLNFNQYDQLSNAFNVNTGSSDYLVTTYPFGSTTLVVFKNKSIIALTNIQGSLANVVATEVTRLVGCIGINAVCSVGSDLVYMSDRNINLISLTDTNNAIQHQTQPLSRNIQRIIQRVNWQYANKVSMTYWDNKLFVALPLDNSTVCSSVVVYNFVTQQWFGEWNFSSSISMAIQNWAIVNYLGATKLHAITEDGRIFVLEGGQNDISGSSVAEVAYSLTTRAYRFDNTLIAPRRLYIDALTNRPNYTVTAYADGASESSVEVSNQTYSRATSWIFNDSTYDLTNANNDFNRAGRQDYSTGPASVQCGTGFQPEMVQAFRLPLLTRKRGRLAWLKVDNATGVFQLNGAGFEARQGYRSNFTQVI